MKSSVPYLHEIHYILLLDSFEDFKVLRTTQETTRE